MESLINGQNALVLVLAMLWTLPWKGYALWTASQMHHKRWFIVLIVLNTFGLLEIFYVFYIAKKTPKDVTKALKSKI
jgi:hypothetical protein